MNKKNVWLDVFDCMFGDKRDQYDFKLEATSEIPDALKEVFSKLQSLTDDSLSTEKLDELFEDELGKPSEITEFSEGNLVYTKKVWVYGDKKMVRITASLADGVKYEDLSLQEKLKLAEQEEDYEKAAELKKELDTQKFHDNFEDDESTENQEDNEKE